MTPVERTPGLALNRSRHDAGICSVGTAADRLVALCAPAHDAIAICVGWSVDSPLRAVEPRRMTDLPTAATVLMPAFEGTGRTVTDRDLLADCEQCAEPRALSTCTVETGDAERVYRCGKCRETLVIVRRPIGVPVAESGYRLGDFVFANAVDVRIEGLNVVLDAMINATTRDVRLQKGSGVDDA